MYKGINDTKSYLSELVSLTKDIESVQLFIIPSYLSLETACSVSEHIMIGAQNVAWENEGQFTGDISCRMLEEVGVKFVMVGHSERRNIFKETDCEENKKVLNALKNDFKVLLCIGETKDEKDLGLTRNILEKQLLSGLYGVTNEHLDRLIVAYEPVWSIGVSGIPATPEYVEKTHDSIRAILVEMYDQSGEDITILYGGSVNPYNCEKLIVKNNVDGLFVGRAAWEADKFDHLIRNSINARKER